MKNLFFAKFCNVSLNFDKTHTFATFDADEQKHFYNLWETWTSSDAM